MGGGGALVWFTVLVRKRAVRCERRKGFTGGVHTVSCFWRLLNCLCVLRKKASIGALGVLFGWKLGDNLLSFDYSVEYAVLINQRSLAV